MTQEQKEALRAVIGYLYEAEADDYYGQAKENGEYPVNHIFSQIVILDKFLDSLEESVKVV